MGNWNDSTDEGGGATPGSPYRRVLPADRPYGVPIHDLSRRARQRSVDGISVPAAPLGGAALMLAAAATVWVIAIRRTPRTPG
ncbi:hypothetical protein OG365_34705 [Streptomyces sp. NBC_00853]|uniref:hypothetical protein n=1 Tax=unclassified Streptomyces TaxID=2593676 RepID=UPI00368DD584|nr:hypothetical protein OG365_34705 [Streptomyces sp. NBC_00853]